MDLKSVTVLTIMVFRATSVTSSPVPHDPTVPPGGPKYVPVFVSADSLNRLNEKDGQTPAQLESGQNTPNNDYINKENQDVLYGPPAPVYEHQPDLPEPSYSPTLPQNYEINQPQIPQQYMQTAPTQQGYLNQQVQQPLQQQFYPVNQQPFQTQQPNQFQQYQMNQPQAQTLYPINQQPQQIQPIVVPQQTGQQPVYGNQQQILQQGLSPQPLLNQQQLVAQPIQTYQQPNLFMGVPNQQTTVTPTQHMLINQQTPMPNQQIIMPQPNLNGQLQAQIPNQQSIILQQPNQNSLIPSNPMLQPNPVNPGYNQNQNQNLYAVVPINGQNLASNQNVGSNTYLVPVQQLPNQVFAVNSGK